MGSIAPWLLALALGNTIRAEQDDVEIAAVRQKYAQSCSGGAASDACKQMRWQLETALYEGMVASMQSGEAPPPSAIRAGLSAEVPQLRALALKLEPEAAVKSGAAVAALESPYATVRQEAVEIIRSWGDEKQRRMLDRQPSTTRPEFPVADTPPDPARLRFKIYPGSTYRYLYSGPEQAYFSTGDSPDKVVAFYAQAGRKAYSASELQQAMKARATAAMDQSKMMKIIQEAQAKGQDPTQAIMAWQKSLAGLGADPTRAFEGKQGIVSPRYIPADDLFSRVLVVFRDDLVGSTAVVVPLPSPGAENASAIPSGDEVMQTVARQQYMAQPIIDSPPPEQ